ncbi:LPXTG cell wall anchor domain-containing protein [Streptomyces hirsutus]|uniref:LPXTG cell wall anchor domain-containing protein n=1 Tax=Streptomyces hirsutus TaxID=35620 RepID=UPI003869A064|nr:LPXTG cell wall anchor domain-containing protein [Streptomyces hirsutus]
MKLRRAMITAAATAVISPLALLSAPVAFATDEQPSTSTSSPSTDGSDSSPEETAPGNTEESSPAADETATDDEQSESSPEETTPGNTEESSPAADETVTDGEEGDPVTDESSPAASPSESEDEGEEAPEDDAQLCVDEDGNEVVELSDDLTSGLSGLPETIVAGSGWTNFRFNVSNTSDRDIADIAPLIGVAAVGWDDMEDYSGEISMQVLDKSSGTWREVAGAAGEGGTFTSFSLGAHKSTSYELRLRVSGDVPDSIGVTGGFAQYSDEGGCWIANDPNGWIYFFDILAAGAEPGETPDAKPQTGGTKPINQVKTVKATGSLAETGAGSALPMIGLLGGAAVVAGAGAVFVVRRRKAGAVA